MGKKEKVDYFKILANQASFAVQEAELLIKVVDEFDGGERVKDICRECHQIENQGDQMNHKLFEGVATDFITPIDSEDLITLAQNLDDVLDSIEDVILSFYMYDVRIMRDDARRFAHIIKEACEALERALKDFGNFKKSKDLHRLIVEVNDCEEEGDRFFQQGMRSLYENDRDNPMHVIVWSQIFKGMESCCDACEHVADTMGSVLLKNS